MLRFCKNYVARHLQASLNSLGQLSRTPLATLMTCTIIGIALALPTALFILLKNAEVISHNFKQTTQLTMYLKPGVTESEALSLAKTLEKKSEIAKVKTISPDQGLKELTQQTDIMTLLAEMKENPLPWALEILPTDKQSSSESLATLAHVLEASPYVDSVQYDSQWAQRFFTVITLAQRAVYALALFLGIGVFLIVNNSIRAATQHNQKEIDVIKLIGGTKAFIRRPFLYAGMLYGLLGGILAWQLVDLLLLWLKAPSLHLATLYSSDFTLLGISLKETFSLLFISLFLGLLGAWLAVARHLGSFRPL